MSFEFGKLIFLLHRDDPNTFSALLFEAAHKEAMMIMKDILIVAATLLFFTASSGFVAGNMLMGNSLGEYLSELVSFDSITMTQMDDILTIADNTTSSDRFEMFNSDESKDVLRTYLYAEVSASNMEEYTAEMIASITSLGALYPTQQLDDFVAFPGPAYRNYQGNGNLNFLGRFWARESKADNIYVGIWGATIGSREYALLTSSWGLDIIDVTNPSDMFGVQSIPMSGGFLWRDAVTHTDAASGKVYAYVAAQDLDNKKASNLFAIDLSRLSGDINDPNGEDSNPIPSGANGFVDLGESGKQAYCYDQLTSFTLSSSSVSNLFYLIMHKGLGHTINAAGGFLFLNSANQKKGCRVYDLSNPMSPNFIFSHDGNGRQCHDSVIVENVNVDGQMRTLWIVSEGSGMKETILDFTDVKRTLSAPPVISTTPFENGIYAHSSVVSEDKRFLFQMDENKSGDIYVYDISNVLKPKLINIFQYAEESTSNAMPHNGHIKGGFLYVAYYEAGYLAFDISNPYDIAEVGRIETYRDPQQTGTNVGQIRGKYMGAWNAYIGLSSGNMLVSDTVSGLYVVKANAPYSKPNAPVVSAERNANNAVTLTWNAAPNARAYSVERRVEGQSFIVVTEFLTTTSYFDDSVRNQNVSYRVKALNGEGESVSAVVKSILSTASPTKKPTNQPTPGPSVGPTPNPTFSPTKAPTPQPSLGPTPLPSHSPTPFPTTAAPTRDVLYRAADGCLRSGETQVDICYTPVIERARAVNCCKGEKTNGTLQCRRPGCSLATSFFDATVKCESEGMRLCSVQELESGICCNKGCQFDFRVGWSSDICESTPQTLDPTSQPTPIPSSKAPTPNPTPLPSDAPTPMPSLINELPNTPYPTFEATAGDRFVAEPL